MDFSEALKLLKEGKVVKRKCCNVPFRIAMDGKNFEGINGHPGEICMASSQILADDWEEVTE